MWRFLSLTVSAVILGSVVDSDRRALLTENVLNIGSISHLGDFWDTWTEWFQCPPGSYVTALKLDYTEEDGFLQHISVACSPQNPPKVRQDTWRISKILNVGAVSKNYTEQDLSSFVSSEQSYAFGISYSTYKRELKSKSGQRNNTKVLVDLEALFDTQLSSAPTPPPLSTHPSIMIDPPINYWIQDRVRYFLCTKGHVLCGLKAELHEARLFANVEAHIRHLKFACCCICSPKQVQVPIAFFRGTENLTIPLGLEFRQDESREGNPGGAESFYLEHFSNSIRDTFDENFERDLKPLPEYIRHLNRNPPAISHPLLKYHNTIPIGVNVYHSSFGSQLFVQPAKLSFPRQGKDQGSISLESATCSQPPFITAGDPFGTDDQRGSNSWDSSAILRSIRQGALVIFLSYKCL